MDADDCHTLTDEDYGSMDLVYYNVRGLFELPAILFSILLHIFCTVLLLMTKNLRKVLTNQLIISNGFLNLFLLVLMSVRVLDEAHDLKVER